jgi:hypothetical protein
VLTRLLLARSYSRRRRKDEWIIIDEATNAPGEVTLPDECGDAPAPAGPPTTATP